MGMTTVSAKIPEELKEELDAADINISETIREALEDEIRRQRRSALRERAATVEGSMDREDIAAAIRSDRDGR